MRNLIKKGVWLSAWKVNLVASSPYAGNKKHVKCENAFDEIILVIWIDLEIGLEICSVWAV